MDVGQLIRALSHYSPDTPVEVVDGNLLTSEVHHIMYGEGTSLIEDMDDGRGGSPTTLYLLTD